MKIAPKSSFSNIKQWKFP